MGALLLLTTIDFTTAVILILSGSFVFGSVSVARRRAVRGQVESIVDAMRLEEKLRLLHGAKDPSGKAEAGYVPGVPRLDVPPLRLTDASPSERADEAEKGFPTPIEVGASFDPALARRVGAAQGREGRARGQTVFLGPRANVLRVPQAAQTHQTFGEDPFLVSQLVGETVEGLEAELMIAAVKYFAGHTFEHNRDRVSVELDERTFREIYLSGFRRAIEKGAGSIVGAPNRLNGTFACDHEWLLTDLLRGELGFSGWVMTDWFARHSLEAFEAGLDQELPGLGRPEDPQAVYFDEPLRAAVQRGRISEREVDASVRRILRQLKRVGLLDEATSVRSPVDPAQSTTVAREAAVGGAVLLQNQGEVLPLDGEDVSSLAVVGSLVERSPFGEEGEPSSLASLRHHLQPEVTIRHDSTVVPEGRPVPSSALSPSSSLNVDGLRRITDNSTVQIDATLDFTGSEALPPGSSWTWTGTITAPDTGAYELCLWTDGGIGRLSIGEEVQRGVEDESAITETLFLEAGESRQITISVDGGEGHNGVAQDDPLQLQLTWISPSRREALLERAMSVAEAADATLVFVADDWQSSHDRDSLALPGAQDALIQAVADAGSSTIVVLDTGGPVAMPWLEDVDAILELWASGENRDNAAAALLSGAAEPGGCLPVTFPRRLSDTPTHLPERYPGTNSRAHHSEGVFVGYRWYGEKGIEPLVHVGHGLAYTTFAYSGLSTRMHGNERLVQFQITNTGTRSGTAVPQLYVGRPPDPPVPMPPKELVGFDKVELDPGETASVAIGIDPRALSFWSEEEKGWRPAVGPRPLYVGASSREIRLQGTLYVD
jgi:beta-glucosidase